MNNPFHATSPKPDNITSHLNLQDGPYIITPADHRYVPQLIPSNGPFSVGKLHVRFPTFGNKGLYGAPRWQHANSTTNWGNYSNTYFAGIGPLASIVRNLGEDSTAKLLELFNSYYEDPQNDQTWKTRIDKMRSALYVGGSKTIEGMHPVLLPWFVPGQFDVSLSKYRSSLPGIDHWKYHSHWSWYSAQTLFTVEYSDGNVWSLKFKIDKVLDDLNVCGPPDGFGVHPTFYAAPWMLWSAEEQNIRPATSSKDSGGNVAYWPYQQWPPAWPQDAGGCYGDRPCWQRKVHAMHSEKISEDCDMAFKKVWVEHYHTGDCTHSTGIGINLHKPPINYNSLHIDKNYLKSNPEESSIHVPLGYAASVSIVSHDVPTWLYDATDYAVWKEHTNTYQNQRWPWCPQPNPVPQAVWDNFDGTPVGEQGWFRNFDQPWDTDRKIDRREDFALHWHTGEIKAAATGDWYGVEDIMRGGNYSGVHVKSVGGLLWHMMKNYHNHYTGTPAEYTYNHFASGLTPYMTDDRPLVSTYDCGLSNTYYFPTGTGILPTQQSWWNDQSTCMTGTLYGPQQDGQDFGNPHGAAWIRVKDGADSFFESSSLYKGWWWAPWKNNDNLQIPRYTGQAINTRKQSNGSYAYESKLFTGFSHQWESMQPWYRSNCWGAPHTASENHYSLAIPGPSGGSQDCTNWYGENNSCGDWEAFPHPHPDHLEPITTSGFSDFLQEFITGTCTGSSENGVWIPSSESCRWKAVGTGCQDSCSSNTTRGWGVINYEFPALMGSGIAKIYDVGTADNPQPAGGKLIAAFYKETLPTNTTHKNSNDEWLERCIVTESGQRMAWIQLSGLHYGSREGGPYAWPPNTGHLCIDENPQASLLHGWDQCTQHNFYSHQVRRLKSSTWMQSDSQRGSWIPNVESKLFKTPQFVFGMQAPSGGVAAGLADPLSGQYLVPSMPYNIEARLDYTGIVPINGNWWQQKRQGPLGFEQHPGFVDCHDCVRENQVVIKETYGYSGLKAVAGNWCIGLYPQSYDRYVQRLPQGHANEAQDPFVSMASNSIGGSRWYLGATYPTGEYPDLWRSMGVWKIQPPDPLRMVNEFEPWCRPDAPTSNCTVGTKEGKWVPNRFNPASQKNVCGTQFGFGMYKQQGKNLLHPGVCSTWRVGVQGYYYWGQPWAPVVAFQRHGTYPNHVSGKLSMYELTPQVIGMPGQTQPLTTGDAIFHDEPFTMEATNIRNGISLNQVTPQGHSNTSVEFYVPGESCYCAGVTGYKLSSSTTAGVGFWRLGSNWACGLDDINAIPSKTSRYLDTTLYGGVKPYQNYLITAEYEYYKRETFWDPYPYGTSYDFYEPVGTMSSYHEWTGEAPKSWGCTFLTWNAGGCGYSPTDSVNTNFVAQGCMCDCRYPFSYRPIILNPNLSIPSYYDYSTWYRYQHQPSRVSPIYAGLEWNIWYGTNTINF